MSLQKSVLGTVIVIGTGAITTWERASYMTYRRLAVLMLLIFMASACSRLADRTRFEGETISRAQATEERARIIERLVPEDTPIPRTRLAAVADATATVIKDIDRDRFPRVASGVRNVLRDASLQDLRRIESILPEIERKRKLEGLD